MATDIKKLVMAGSAISIGDWVEAGGAGTLAAVGALKTGSELNIELTDFEIETDDDVAPVAAPPVTLRATLTATLAEADLERLQYILSQPPANKTGTTPNFTLLVGAVEEQYKQVQLTTKGVAGTNFTRATRTITLWRCVVRPAGPVVFSAKRSEQLYAVTIKALADPTVTTADQVMDITDTGGA